MAEKTKKPKKLTVADIAAAAATGRKLTMLTAYDAGFAALVDACGVDMILVGDSLGMVVLGYDSTVPVTMEEMLHHCRAAGRGRRRALLVGDMPFMSYQTGVRDAVVNAGRFLKEGGCDAVKLEGGLEVCDAIRAIVRAGIPVMGHIGLTPQTAGNLGGFKVQGRDLASARRILAEARALEDAGVFALVLECVPGELARAVSGRAGVPVIGIGAGPHCDGQVLVTHDLVGLFERFTPSFVKKYAELAPMMKEAVSSFIEEVESGAFPAGEHTFSSGEALSGLLDEGE